MPSSTQGYTGYTRVNIGQPTPISDKMLHPGSLNFEQLAPDGENLQVSCKLSAPKAWTVDHDVEGWVQLPQVFYSPGEYQASTFFYPGKNERPGGEP